MHWLEQQIDRLAGLAHSTRRIESKEAFLRAIRELVDALAKHEGVTAAFASHDGLALEVAGQTPDFEALSAMAQWSLAAAKETALTLSLGRMGQMVIVGAEHKLALFHIGQLAVGILSPVHVNLGRALEMGPHQNGEATPMPRPLLARLGGRDAIEAVVALFYARVLRDPELAPFFRGVSMPRMQQLQTDFFCAALGGEPWQGRDLKAVHAGLRLTDHHFDLVAKHLHDALEEAGVPGLQIEEVINLVATLRPQIVSAHAPVARATAQGERK